VGLAEVIEGRTGQAAMSEPQELSEEQLATDPRIGMRRLTFEFLLQQEYFGTPTMMVAECIPASEAKGYFEFSEAVVCWRLLS